MQLEAGELDTRLYLKKQSDKRNNYGDIEREIWIDNGSRLGKIDHLSVKSAAIAKGISESIDTEAKTLFWKEVNSSSRIVAREKTYQVIKVFSDQKENWTQIYLSLINE